MSRNSALLIALVLAACSNAPAAVPEDEEIVVATTEPASPSPENLLGRWGATAADCDPANRYMTEFVELDDKALHYRGEDYALAGIEHDSGHIVGFSIRHSGRDERLLVNGDRMTRWPDDKARRTDYHRCG